jgi:hypothetical protein
MIQGSSVIRALKDRGYEFDFISSFICSPASIRWRTPATAVTLCSSSKATAAKVTPLSAIGFGGLDYRAHRRKLAEAFSLLEALPARTGPHACWRTSWRLIHRSSGIRRAAGSSLSSGLFAERWERLPGSRDDYLTGYAGQVRYVAGASRPSSND